MNEYQNLRNLAEYIYGLNDHNYLSFDQTEMVISGMKELGISYEQLPQDGLVPLINGEINKIRLSEQTILHTQ